MRQLLNSGFLDFRGYFDRFCILFLLCASSLFSIDLTIVETQIQVKGKVSPVYDIVLKDGSRILQRKEGEDFDVVVQNNTTAATSLHWHGLILPVLEDGVPYVTQAPIAPGKSHPYHFQVVQSGTFFAHSHFGLQEQKLMNIPLLLMPKEESPYRDVVVLFEDFTFQSIDSVWQSLRKKYRPNADLSPKMKMSRPDLNDVVFDAFLANRKTLEDPDVQIVKPGETVRLRLINSSTASAFKIDLGGLSGNAIAVDGNRIEPIPFDDFPLATAQRMDILLAIPKEGGAFTISAQGQGTEMIAGIVLKTVDAKIPSLSMQAKSLIGAINNAFEKKLRAEAPLVSRKVDRRLLVELEGNMEYYTWAINNRVWPDSEPLFVKEGERVEIAFVNKTEMSHPMHLHGHVFQVVEIDGEKFSGAVRDTILVMPGQTVKVILDANNPGIWALHCHIAYHSWAGMFTVLKYEGYTPPYFSPSAIHSYSRIYGGY